MTRIKDLHGFREVGGEVGGWVEIHVRGGEGGRQGVCCKGKEIVWEVGD